MLGEFGGEDFNKESFKASSLNWVLQNLADISYEGVPYKFGDIHQESRIDWIGALEMNKEELRERLLKIPHQKLKKIHASLVNDIKTVKKFEIKMQRNAALIVNMVGLILADKMGGSLNGLNIITIFVSTHVLFLLNKKEIPDNCYMIKSEIEDIIRRDETIRSMRKAFYYESDQPKKAGY